MLATVESPVYFSSQQMARVAGTAITSERQTPRVPSSIQVYFRPGPLNHSPLVLVNFLPAELEIAEDNEFIISDLIFKVYGHGRTISKAIGDFTKSLEEYYEIVERNSGNDVFDRAVLEELERYLSRRPVGTKRHAKKAARG